MNRMIAMETRKINKNLVTARELVSRINGDPRKIIGISASVRQLLKDVPCSRVENFQTIIVARYLREELRNLFNDRNYMVDACSEVTFLNCIINSRKPAYISIH